MSTDDETGDHYLSSASESDLYGVSVQCVCGWMSTERDLTLAFDEFTDHLESTRSTDHRFSFEYPEHGIPGRGRCSCGWASEGDDATAAEEYAQHRLAT